MNTKRYGYYKVSHDSYYHHRHQYAPFHREWYDDDNTNRSTEIPPKERFVLLTCEECHFTADRKVMTPIRCDTCSVPDYFCPKCLPDKALKEIDENGIYICDECGQ